MEKILKKEILESFKKETLSTMEARLRDEHDLTRGIAVNVIGLRLEEGYARYSKVLLDEMNVPIHFSPVKLGIKTAWNIAVVLAENLKETDYMKLKTAFNKWPKGEKTDLLEWLNKRIFCRKGINNDIADLKSHAVKRVALY
jgi:hypothetical protein